MELKSSYCKLEIPGENIWIGNAAASFDPNFLYPNNINVIINLTPAEGADCEDISTYDLPIALRELFEDEFDRTMKILMKISQRLADLKEDKKTIYIHCDDGVNRAPLVVCHYLMTKRDYTSDAALDIVRAANDTRGAKTLTNTSYRQIVRDLKK